MTRPTKAIAVRLNREALALLSRQPSSVRIELGQDATVVIGDKSFPINMVAETATAHQLFERDPVDQRQIHLVGSVTHRATMKQVLSQEDKSRIRSWSEAAERERTARRIELLDIPNIQSLNHKTSTAKRASTSPGSSRMVPRPQPPAPAARAATATPATPSSSTLRERLIHLLALRPCKELQLTSMLKVSHKELAPLLAKEAVKTGQEWCLRPEVYKDLKIWEWNRYDDKERSIVFQNTKEVYEFLRLPNNAPERANLARPKSKHQDTAASQLASQSQPQPSHRITPNGAPSPSSRKRPSPSQAVDKPRKLKKKKSSKERMLSKARKGNEDTVPFRLTQVSHAAAQAHPSNNGFSLVPSTPFDPTPSSLTAHPHQHPHPQHPSTSLSDTSTSIDTPLASTSESGHSSAVTTATLDISATDSSDDDIFSDEEPLPPYTLPPINCQSDFDDLCREHDLCQRQYSRLRRRINEDHPQFVEALLNVPTHTITNGNNSNAMDVDDTAKAEYYQKLRQEYKALGGDMSQWRGIMRLSRDFNWQLCKTTLIWDELERVYRQSRYRLPVTTHRNHRQ